MIQLHQFAPAFGLLNASPFCMKVEVYLRLAGLPYEAVNSGDVLRAPKRKLPFIVDDGQRVADSTFIIEHLRHRHGDPLDGQLGAVDRAVATAFQRLLEEDLYWALVYTRWGTDAGWALTRPAFFGALPPPLRWIVPPLARRGVLAQLRGHGMGRHGADEIHAIGCRDITAVATFLADKPFLLGEQPTSIDASAYALLANVLWAPLASPLRQAAREQPALEAYCQRMRARVGG
jgi:glutathione S-transferase